MPRYSKIKALGITAISPISCIKASIRDPEYAHVMSFRRQVYLNPDDIGKLSESMKIDFDETTYWIYFSSDKAPCFLCKEEGHLAKDCPTLSYPYNLTSNEQNNTQELSNQEKQYSTTKKSKIKIVIKIILHS